jgi:glycosyltransferase involved in cell wall biosynthesis
MGPVTLAAEATSIRAVPERIDVLQVAASVAPRDGGPATGILALNAALRARGLNAVVLATNADGHHDRLDVPLGSLVDLGPARIGYGDRSRPYRLKNSWQQARQVWQLAARASVLHVHGTYLAHAVWAHRAARHHGVPYVVQPHGSLEPYQQRRGRLRKAVFDAAGGDALLSDAAFLVAASPAERANLMARVPGATVHALPLGVSLPAPRIPAGLSPADRHRLAAVRRADRVVFVGRLAAKKRPDVLVDAWASVARPEGAEQDGGGVLVVAGPGEDWEHADLLGRLPAGRRGSVVVLEQLERAEVAWLLRECGIFVLPSENENFGIAVAEAMASGCAVVTTRATAAGEHVRAAGAGVVLDAPDPAALGEVLTRLMGNPDLVEEMGRRGARYAEQRLTWPAMAASLAAAYPR